jgi:hypothetical protein
MRIIDEAALNSYYVEVSYSRIRFYFNQWFEVSGSVRKNMLVFTGLCIWHGCDAQCSASREVPTWKPKDYYHGHKSPPLVSIPSHIYPIHTLSCKIPSNIDLPSMNLSSIDVLPLYICCSLWEQRKFQSMCCDESFNLQNRHHMP